jgi:uncharacterized protein (DUF1697 family)
MTLTIKSYISLLRGINVSGNKTIRMADLQSLYQSLNFSNIVTYLQSGNVIFNSPEQDNENLAELIQNKIEKIFGFSVNVFIRDHEDFRRIIDRNPFLHKMHEDPAHLYVTFLSHSISTEQVTEQSSGMDKNDVFITGVDEIYLFCPDGYSRTKFSNTYFEKHFQQPATTCTCSLWSRCPPERLTLARRTRSRTGLAIPLQGTS